MNALLAVRSRPSVTLALACMLSVLVGCTDPQSEPIQPEPAGPFVFREMALTTLDNMVDHALTPEGQWLYTATGDTPGVAPRALFAYGKALGRADLEQIALESTDLYREQAADVLMRWANGEDVSSSELTTAFGGASSLIDAYLHTGDASYINFISIRLRMINEMIIEEPTLIESGGAFSIYGPLFTGGGIATINAEIAMAMKKVIGELDSTATLHLTQADQILAMLEPYRTDDGHYTTSPSGTLNASDSSNMLMALATMAQATGEQAYLDQALTIVDALSPLWDEMQGAYLNDATGGYIGLAENNIIFHGQLILFELTGDTAMLDRAEAFYAYDERVLFKQLPQAFEIKGKPWTGGFAVMLHDNEGAYDKWYWCSGCNFIALHSILRLNQLRNNLGPAEAP